MTVQVLHTRLFVHLCSIYFLSIHPVPTAVSRFSGDCSKQKFYVRVPKIWGHYSYHASTFSRDLLTGLKDHNFAYWLSLTIVARIFGVSFICSACQNSGSATSASTSRFPQIWSPGSMVTVLASWWLGCCPWAF